MAKKKKTRLGEVKKKILLLLMAGTAIGLSGRSFKKQGNIYKELGKEWKEINRQTLASSLNSLFTAELISLKENSDGTYSITLSNKGKLYTNKFNIDKLSIESQRNWDGRWRLVMFDIPEKFRKVRDALRFHFKKLGLIEYQKSVFIHPYPCEKEIKFVIECYNSKNSVRFVVAEAIDNAPRFRKYFGV